MAVRDRQDELAGALKRLRPLAGATRARARAEMMSAAERVAFADAIRARSRPTTEDSTDLIRRDRDER